MRILVSGASGFIGAPLLAHLQSLGHEVVSLVRKGDAPDRIVWDFVSKKNISPFENFDVVIHLAGEPLTFFPWSEKKKREIFKSRVESTNSLSEILSKLTHPPKLFLSASAVGYYGDSNDEILTERSKPGTGFLSHVCVEWERANWHMNRTKRIITRFGMVLGDGGAMQLLKTVYKLGLGGKIGNGEQWISWIHIEDVVSAITSLLESKLEGPINIVTENPVQQKEFSKILAKTLHRPAFFKVPASLLRVCLKEVAEEMLLTSTRVKPEKLLEAHFQFKYPDLALALRSIC